MQSRSCAPARMFRRGSFRRHGRDFASLAAFIGAVNIDYQEWRPCAALNDVVLACWRVAGDGTSVPSPTILPDAYVEIVLNLGDGVTLEGAAITGRQPERAVVGLLETAIEMHYPRDVCTFGIRLHPARAAAFLGVPAHSLMNKVSPLADISPRLDTQLARIVETQPRIESAAARDAVETVLTDHLRQVPPIDDLV